MPGLDPLIHAPTRLSIMALLAGLKEAEFSTVRDSVGISDSVLSRQASALEAASYIKIRKGYVGKRPRTWLSLTPAGRHAFDAHVAALQRIVAQADSTSQRSRRIRPMRKSRGQRPANASGPKQRSEATEHCT